VKEDSHTWAREAEPGRGGGRTASAPSRVGVVASRGGSQAREVVSGPSRGDGRTGRQPGRVAGRWPGRAMSSEEATGLGIGGGAWAVRSGARGC
jgi:hypothetical protein